MSYEIEGKLHKKYDTEKKSESFQTREFVLSDESSQYPNFVKFQLTQDRVSILDPIPEGTTIKVYFDLRGREWQGKYFTNLQAWRIENAGENKPRVSPSDFPTESPGHSGDNTGYDDLPF